MAWKHQKAHGKIGASLLGKENAIDFTFTEPRFDSIATLSEDIEDYIAEDGSELSESDMLVAINGGIDLKLRAKHAPTISISDDDLLEARFKLEEEGDKKFALLVAAKDWAEVAKMLKKEAVRKQLE